MVIYLLYLREPESRGKKTLIKFLVLSSFNSLCPKSQNLECHQQAEPQSLRLAHRPHGKVEWKGSPGSSAQQSSLNQGPCTSRASWGTVQRPCSFIDVVQKRSRRCLEHNYMVHLVKLHLCSVAYYKCICNLFIISGEIIFENTMLGFKKESTQFLIFFFLSLHVCLTT